MSTENPIVGPLSRPIQLPLLRPQHSGELGAVEAKGVVFTKRWVVELLLDLTGYKSDANLVDAMVVEPAAGEGAFLVPMIERLTASCVRLGRPLSECQESLIAYELDDASAQRARKLASNMLVQRDMTNAEAERIASHWIRTGDYLSDAKAIPADFVVGNPPYVRLEEIPEEVANFYRHSYSTMRGRADLYVAFFEAALRQLKPGGACAFICADRWMRNQYGAALRDMITSAYSVDVLIEMHGANAFHDEVDAYPAMTVIRYKKQASTVVASAVRDIENIPTQALARMFEEVTSAKSAEPTKGLRVARVNKWFVGPDPWPCETTEQLALLRRLEDLFPPLETSAKVGIGVATGNDGIFITTDARLVESSRLLKLALARDISNGKVEWSGHYLVDPWNSEGLVSLSDYPRLHEYFGKHADALKLRHTAANNLHGWYKTIDRVTHSLAAKPKLYIADIKNRLDPVLDLGQTYPHHNLYFIQSDAWNLEALGGLLMSSIGQFFVESYGVRMRGGYLRFQAQYLRRIRVPSPDSISDMHTNDLVEAFRTRDRQQATRTALEIYGIEETELEAAIGHR